jgi:hypothetical protein
MLQAREQRPTILALCERERISEFNSEHRQSLGSFALQKDAFHQILLTSLAPSTELVFSNGPMKQNWS